MCHEHRHLFLSALRDAHLSNSFVNSNTASRNGSGSGIGAGIHSTSNDNRIEGNNVADNDRGIHVEGTGSLVIKNSASSNPANNYEIAASNNHGAIIDLTATAAAAANGNSAPGTLTTDSDGDGMTDLQEYLEGTNPLLAGDRLRITNYSTNSGGTSSLLVWTSTPARLYQIETNPDLLSTWVNDPTFGVITPDVGATTTRTVTAATAPKRFYRVRAIRPLAP